ncbi:deoxyhypusine synthase family protein [Sulfobacillus acidophilus]|uniref:Deoxyhypusine synthase family protein n=1 Tax=Sulfobacillus acidophilus TaxID=53633 RepID=A0ABS3AVH4_9FIRM|nr:deoxyhypusine synthase family protein [Sulfobacillus acidophilus]
MPKNFNAIKEFMDQNYLHFNARTTVEAAKAWVEQLKLGNKMFVSIAGAMSTAELGISLAEMIRQDKIQAICCTGANLEEDVFNLVANKHYEYIKDWRSLTAEDEEKLLGRHLNRVTDTCIPEEEAMRRIEKTVLKYWEKADLAKKSFFPYEFLYKILLSGELEKHYQIDPKNSWLLAAAQKNLPIFTPGWEDSTLGNVYTASCMAKKIQNIHTVKSGVQQMEKLIKWYQENTKNSGIGFFQIGGGIAGDFPICVVPLIEQDMNEKAKLWSYFCQISDSTTSYGSYSGAVPNEKITWGKLDTKSPKFIIESDATIVAPLIFSYVLAS